MKRLKIIGIILLTLSLTFTAVARPHGHRGGGRHHRPNYSARHHSRHYHRPPPPRHYHHRHHYRSSDWWIPATILGSAAVISSAVRRPDVVYVESTPSTVVVQPTERVVREEIKADGTRILYYQ